MSELDRRLDGLVERRREQGRYRELSVYPSTLRDFSSNDYLSLSTCPELRAAYLARLAATPRIFGSTGSRLLSGASAAHAALEARLAAHFAAPAALLFGSGYDANASFFAAVPQPGDWVVYDELVHASVHAGMRAGRAGVHYRSFKHNDAADLRGALAAVAGGAGIVFLAVESLYSMDGDFAPLPALLDTLDAAVSRARQCVVVDEAHTTGVYGYGGRGVVHALGEAAGDAGGAGRVGVRLMTFGKGVGCSGAAILCSPAVRAFLVNFARPLIFSTAPPHSTLVALDCAWDVLSTTRGDEKRQALYAVAADFSALLSPILASCPASVLRLPPASPPPFPDGVPGLPPAPTPSPIVALLTPRPHALAAFLRGSGHVVRPVVPPTVPAGAERVRVCLAAGMRGGDVRALVGALGEWVEAERARLEATARHETRARL